MRCFERYLCFTSDRTSLEDKEMSGWLSIYHSQIVDKNCPWGSLMNHSAHCWYCLCHTEQHRKFLYLIWTCITLLWHSEGCTPWINMWRPDHQCLVLLQYCETFKERLQLWCKGNWMLHHDKAPTHRVLDTSVLNHNSIITLYYLPYWSWI